MEETQRSPSFFSPNFLRTEKDHDLPRQAWDNEPPGKLTNKRRVAFRFVSFRFVSFRFVSFRFSQCSGTTHLIEQGDALFHCGGLRHAAAPITSGRRMLLVGFVDVRPVRPTDDAAAAAAAVDDAAD